MIYWIWLAERIGYGNPKLKKLLLHFYNALNIYKADPKTYAAEFGLDDREVKSLSNKSLKRCENIINACNENDIKIISISDASYPECLRNIDNPPAVLYYKGELPDFSNLPSISLVGTRKADTYSIKAAWSLSARLSLANFIVVSGGALGIDSAAHKGAMDTNGITVALLACGINYPYLKSNEELRKSILEGGCLISEFPPDYPLKKFSFHLRNRLISGISLGTVIIEAGENSGALITARNANEQGRDVFVITGKPDDKKYQGSYALLRDGAIPVFKAEDIISEYLHIYGNVIDAEKALNFDLSALYTEKYSVKTAPKTVVKTEKTANQEAEEKIFSKNLYETLSKNAKLVYNCINMDNFTVDDLITPELSFSEVLSVVTELELSGLITAIPGGRYTKLYKE